MLVTTVFAGSALLGACSHWAAFVRGEWEAKLPGLVLVGALLEATVALYLVRWSGAWTLEFGLSLASVNIGYMGGLMSSIAVYRLCFHRLRAFPGPVPGRLSVIWSTYKTVPHFQFYRVVQQLHKKHGDFVRIRPREISICNADAVNEIHASGSPFIKGPFYDVTAPSRSLLTIRDKGEHSQRRRLWARAFTSTALGEYEPRVTEHCMDLVRQLSARPGQRVDVPRWISYFGYDVMGDLVFGKPFDMIKTAGDHFIFEHFENQQVATGLLLTIPWLFILFLRLRGVGQVQSSWIGWCAEQMEKRRKADRSRKDLFSFILGEAAGTSKVAAQLSESDLVLESELAIIGGSNTTSTSVTAMLFLLARHPEKLRRLQQELDQLFAPGEEVSHRRLATDAPFLNACINETLRLYPVVPGGLQRVTPPQGASIAGHWIPGDTVISTPTFALHRDSRYFAQPDSFIPERWSSQPSLVRNKDAFNPFLIGSYSCIGKNLAYLEMRLLGYYLVRNFSFCFPPGDINGVDPIWLLDQPGGFSDYLSASAAPFNLVFTPRDGEHTTDSAATDMAGLAL